MQFAIINKPKKPTEFEMQSELYFHLKQCGYDVRGEVRSKFKNRRSRFDLVIFIGNQAAIIIEVKDSKNLRILNGHHTKQRKKYSEYGIPLIYYTTAKTIQNVLDEIKETFMQILQ